MKTLDVKQGSSEWLWARAGIVTASELDNLISPTWKIRDGDTPATYMHMKIAEKLMGQPINLELDTFAMDQGRMLESEAIPWLTFMHGINVERVGMCLTDDGRVGASPDGLIGEDGGVEVKCPRPQTHVKYLLNGVVPTAYLAQVHGSLWVTGRKFWYFLSYSRQFPKLLIRVERDEAIMSAISRAIETYYKAFDAGLAKINQLKS